MNTGMTTDHDLKLRNICLNCVKKQTEKQMLYQD